MYVLQVAVALGWMLCIGCLMALVYGLYDTHLDRVPAAAYSSLSHTAWAICLSWIVIACSTGYGGQRCYGIYYTQISLAALDVSLALQYETLTAPTLGKTFLYLLFLYHREQAEVFILCPVQGSLSCYCHKYKSQKFKEGINSN